MYGVPEALPGVYGGLEPYVTPYCLPATHIALTGGKEFITQTLYMTWQ